MPTQQATTSGKRNFSPARMGLNVYQQATMMIEASSTMVA
jgi:hypothetical protein